jgi:hypothetical protein
MKKTIQIVLIVLLVSAFAMTALQVIAGCQSAQGVACLDVGWNTRASVSSSVAYSLPGTIYKPQVGWNT